MTTHFRHTRPNSAVYLGSDPLHLASTPPGIPDLPEPPSPISSTGSGLPSPPATNSTGSGSTGDPASIAVRSSAKLAASMLSHTVPINGPTEYDDDDDCYNDLGNEIEEEDTARLNRLHSLKSVSVNENTLAIQRALTLKERTRMTIDKLSSYSRNTPSPSAHTRSSDSSSSTSRHQLLEQHHSGSETEHEREPIDSDHRPSTPRLNRTRLISAPASPGKALSIIKQSNPASSNSSDSPARLRQRASMANANFAEFTSRTRIRFPDEFERSQTSRQSPDVIQVALAAVASSRGRMSPTSSAKKRQPLPKEFLDASISGSASISSASRKGSLSGLNTFDNVGYDSTDNQLSTELSTPQTSRPSSTMKYLQLSPRQQKNLNNTLTHSSLRHPYSDPRPNLERSSTLRRHQTGGRWVSEDMSVASSLRTNIEQDENYQDIPNFKGRRQTLRTGGSADSALTVGAGRSLVGEGLKAAGLRSGGTVGRRGDIFDENTPLREKVARDRERAQRGERTDRSISRNRIRSRSRLDWEDDDDDGDEVHSFKALSRANGSDIRTRAGTVVGPRASTSMAILDHERESAGGEPEPQTAPPHLRSYKSSYDLVISQEALSRREVDLDKEMLKDREYRAPSSLSRYASSPFGSNRRDTLASDRSDHNRLLYDSLNMFENHVTRVPSTSSATASDLLRNAQNIAGAAEKLNLMTRAAMSKALDAQINAEVDASGCDLAADIWRAVGADYRDQMRVSDELVRSVTDFLLGVGRAVKDMTSGADGHGRSASMDEFGGRNRSSLGSDRGSNGSGRRSEESRSNWGDDVKRFSTGPKRSESILNGRPSSVLNARDHDTPLSIRSRQPNGNINVSHVQESSRRGLDTIDSQETLHAVNFDPSPTPAPRAQSNSNPNRPGANLNRARTLPPLSIPKPLAQLPSESLVHRQTQTPASSSSRRRPTTAGTNNARGPFPLTSHNIPTTALTPHTVTNGERQDFPMLRSDSGSGSGKSSGAMPRSTVTFSRSSTVSALIGLQQQQQLAEQQKQRKRTQSNSSNSGAEAVERVLGITRTTSGSETERPTRTIGRQGNRSRMSLDDSGTLSGNVHPADRSAAASILATSKPRERRKTVVDIWSRT